MILSGTVFLHDNAPNAGRSLVFERPLRVLTTRKRTEVAALIAEAEQASAAGKHLAGYLSYELGLAFEQRLLPLLAEETEFPLLWLGIYDAPLEMDRLAAWRWLKERASRELVRVDGLKYSMTRGGYGGAFKRVMDYIHAGDVYQINLTMHANFQLHGDPAALYRDLCRSQPVAHGAFIHTGEHHLLSLSPELFIENRGGRIVTRPMKGTAPRGLTSTDDDAIKRVLAADEKSRAENLMIVDLLRNDVGRIAKIGSVKVEKLFSIETYRSLHQMTSTIAADMKPGLKLGEILRALFPCGSVTGAPKIRAMQIIHEVENGARGLYTGSIGHVAPNRDFSFNVAIRTAVIGEDGAGEIGIGGGIVADSQEDAEYNECLLKLDFFRQAVEPPSLIETTLWAEDEFWLLSRHLARLERSAAHFGYRYDRGTAIAALEQAVAGKCGPLRVRLVLSPKGEISASAVPPPPAKRFRFLLADDRMDSGDPLLRHKTTRRAIYDKPREEAQKFHGADEVIFRNERGELTEGSFTNLFIEKGGELLTPALSCGLLPGTLREQLLQRGEAREAILTLRDLEAADKIFLGNSVRGLVRAERVDAPVSILA
ncbi:MAG TPA: aminodeoxychorismate synthase component I [Xanthobacteraceae bacterium]|nr:aminodeoxychorismate synthase component I [Xanthobacteraceae bacterium]